MTSRTNRFEFLRRSFSFVATVALVTILPTIAVAQDEKHPVIVEVEKQLGDRDPGKAFVLQVDLVTKDGMGKKVIQAMRAATAPTRKEPGNGAYLLMQSPTDKTVFSIHERWKSVAALISHLKEPHTIELLEKFDKALAQPPTLTVMQPVFFGNGGGKGAGKRAKATAAN